MKETPDLELNEDGEWVESFDEDTPAIEWEDTEFGDTDHADEWDFLDWCDCEDRE